MQSLWYLLYALFSNRFRYCLPSHIWRGKDKFLQKSELSRKCPQANAVTLSYLRPHRRRDTLDMEPWRQPSLDRHDTNSDRPMSQNW